LKSEQVWLHTAGCADREIQNVATPGAGAGRVHGAALWKHGAPVPGATGGVRGDLRSHATDRGGRERVPAQRVRSCLGRVGERTCGRAACGAAVLVFAGQHRVGAGRGGVARRRVALGHAATDDDRRGCSADAGGLRPRNRCRRPRLRDHDAARAIGLALHRGGAVGAAGRGLAGG